MAGCKITVTWVPEVERFNSHAVMTQDFGPAHALVAAYALLAPMQTPEMEEVKRLMVEAIRGAKPMTRH